MLTDRLVNRSFELADILDWGFPIKSSELAGGNLEATLKEILGLELYISKVRFKLYDKSRPIESWSGVSKYKTRCRYGL